MTVRGPTISAVIVSCNEAQVIEPCLQSVADWVDEIVVVDMHSTDATREIARRYTEHLFDHPQLSYAEPALNLAFAKATGEWIIVLAPDERAPRTLATELERIASLGIWDVVVIPFRNWAFGKPLKASGYQFDAHPRFFRNGTISWPIEVHSRPSLAGLRVKYLARADGLEVQHHTWPTIASQVERTLRYAPNEVSMLNAGGAEFGVLVMFYSMWAAFRDSFIKGKGYEDGVRGLFVGLLLLVYRMVIHMQLWEVQGKPSKADKAVTSVGMMIYVTYIITEKCVRALRAMSSTVSRVGNKA